MPGLDAESRRARILALPETQRLALLEAETGIALRLLESGANAQIPGVSGVLKLGPNRNIERELSWATVTDGLVRPARQ